MMFDYELDPIEDAWVEDLWDGEERAERKWKEDVKEFAEWLAEELMRKDCPSDDIPAPERKDEELKAEELSIQEKYQQVVEMAKKQKEENDMLREKLERQQQRENELETELEYLRLRLAKQDYDLHVYQKVLDERSGHWTQRELLKQGKKLAYREDASVYEVKALLDKGYTKTAIAEQLGVSRNTVYRRIKEIESYHLEGGD